MEYRKLMLGAASLLAIAVTHEANARVNPREMVPADQSRQGSMVASQGDPLLELIVQTGGSLTAESVTAAIESMFSTVGPEQLRRLPQFLADASAIGLPEDVKEALRDALLAVVADAAAPVDARDAVASSLMDGGASPILLAEAQASDNICDPRLTPVQRNLDPDCAPDETGSTNRNNPANTAPATTGGIGGGGYI